MAVVIRLRVDGLRMRKEEGRRGLQCTIAMPWFTFTSTTPTIAISVKREALCQAGSKNASKVSINGPFAGSIRLEKG